MINIKRRSLIVRFFAAGTGLGRIDAALLNKQGIDGCELPKHQT